VEETSALIAEIREHGEYDFVIIKTRWVKGGSKRIEGTMNDL
jgi:hypothetical protein